MLATDHTWILDEQVEGALALLAVAMARSRRPTLAGRQPRLRRGLSLDLQDIVPGFTQVGCPQDIVPQDEVIGPQEIVPGVVLSAASAAPGTGRRANSPRDVGAAQRLDPTTCERSWAAADRSCKNGNLALWCETAQGGNGGTTVLELRR